MTDRNNSTVEFYTIPTDHLIFEQSTVFFFVLVIFSGSFFFGGGGVLVAVEVVESS